MMRHAHHSTLLSIFDQPIVRLSEGRHGCSYQSRPGGGGEAKANRQAVPSYRSSKRSVEACYVENRWVRRRSKARRKSIGNPSRDSVGQVSVNIITKDDDQ